MSADLGPSEIVALKEFAEQTKVLIVKAIKTKKITKFGAVDSSGALANSVEIKYTDTGFQILANDYIIGLIHGVRPGQSTATVGSITKWIQEKPVKSDIPIGTLAAMIVRKQEKEGNMVWRTHKGANSGLLHEPLEESRFDNFTELLASKAVESLTKELVEAYEFKAVA